MGMIGAPAMAQQSNDLVLFSNRDAITTSFVHTTNYNGTDQSTEAQWEKIEFHYSVNPPAGAGDYIDEIEFKIWVEGRDLYDPAGKPGEGVAIGMTGSAIYVNVKKGKDAYGVVYLNPSSIGRYNMGGGPADFEHKFNIHIEAYVGGTYVDSIDKNKEDDKKWFQSLKPITGLLYLQYQSPYILTDPDRYPALKMPNKQ